MPLLRQVHAHHLRKLQLSNSNHTAGAGLGRIIMHPFWGSMMLNDVPCCVLAVYQCPQHQCLRCFQVAVITVKCDSTCSSFSRHASSMMRGCPTSSRGFLWISLALDPLTVDECRICQVLGVLRGPRATSGGCPNNCSWTLLVRSPAELR